MKALVLAAATLATPALAQPVAVPSGQPVEFVEVIRDVRSVRGLSWRFRFVAREIDRNSGSVTFESAALDMDHLCQNFAIQRLPIIGARPGEIVISFSSAPLEFGEVNPEITQFFEVYSVQGDKCVWEGF